jgi:hypothetical protein
MEEAPVGREEKGPVSVLTLQYRPYNLLGPTLIGAIADEIAAARDAGSRAIILRSGLRHFSAGADVAQLSAGIEQGGRSQSAIGGVQFLKLLELLPIPIVAGVPGAAMLGFVGLLLAISQIGGPLLVLIWGAAAWWLFAQDHAAWGAFMIVWGVLVSTVDNFIKPWLIGFGMEMPMSLTILGVFGGFIAFGFLGLFIGPTLIAIVFTLLQSWRAAVSSPPVAEAIKPAA